MTTEPPLTPRQRQIVDYLEEYQRTHRHAPSVREIADGLGLSSPATVHAHLKQLRQKGVIETKPRSRRGLRLVKTAAEDGLVELPFVGQVTAGHPLEFFAQPQQLSVARSLAVDPEHAYILQAHGDTMLDVLVADGDLLIVQARGWADEGELLLGVLSSGESVLRRFQWGEDGNVRLEGAMPNSQAYEVDANNLSIHGVVSAVLRLF